MTRVAEPDDPHAFRFEAQGYTLRGPTGRIERFDVPWSRELLADLEVLRRPGRDPAVIQRIGDVMQRALRTIGWSALSESIRAASEAGREVVVTVRANAAELYALPWELVTVGASGRHLGELPGVVLRHEWPGTATSAERPSPRPEGGRVLFAWSAAGGGVPTNEHQRALSEACSKGHVVFDPATDVVEHVSASRLAEALDAAEAAGTPFAVLHVLCHGGRAGSTFGLVVDGEAGSEGVVDGGRLRQLLAPHARSLRLVVLAACDGGNSGDPGNHLGSVAQALHRAGIEAVVASRYPLSIAGSNVLAATLYRALLVDLLPVGRALVEVRARLARLTGSLDWASLQLYAREADGSELRPVVFCPYRGLRAFEPEHRRFFFGRDREREETLADLQALIDGGHPRFLVVYGASGTGKSSVVLAGVAPDIARVKAKRAGPWEVRTMKPGAQPLAALDELLADAPAAGPRLLVVDQFEEVFTHVDDPAARTAFVRRLWSLAGADSGVHVIITLRVDFLGRCGELLLDDAGLGLDRVAYDEAHRVAVARMGPEQVREVLERPAARVGLRFAPGLLDRILADVGAEPGALPLLQYALGRLWAQREGQVLRAAAYEAMGGLVGALEKDADELVRRLDSAELGEARRILVRLVDARDDEGLDTRRRVELAQLQPAGAEREAVFDRVVARLVEARLVVRSEDEHDKTRTLEVAHEALIRRWAVLRRWIAEDREKLAELERLRVWAEHQAPLTGSRLERALDFLREHGDDVDRAVRAFIEASEAERQRSEAERAAAARRRRRTVIGVIVSLSTMLVLAVGLGVWALGAEAAATKAAKGEAAAARAAERSAAEAKEEAKRAVQAQRLAGARLALMDKDPTAVALILSEEEDPVSAEGWLQASVDAAALPIARVILRRPTEEGRTTWASFSPDGDRVVTGTGGGVAWIWPADGRGEPVELSGNQGSIASASFSADGVRVVTASVDGSALVWRSTGVGEPVVLGAVGGYNRDVVWASFSPDGLRVVTVPFMGDAQVWLADGRGSPMALETGGDRVLAASFSPEGDRVVSGHGDGSARVWRVDGSRPPRVLKGHTDRVEAASFSPDGRWILTASMDSRALLWPADGHGEPRALAGHTEGIWSASFSADGRLVVTASGDKTACLWRVDEPGEPVCLKGHDGEVRAASFSADGRRVVTDSRDGTVRVWRADGALLGVLPGVSYETRSAASISRDGQSVVTICEDSARIWRADGPGELVTAEESRNTLRSPDGRKTLTLVGELVAIQYEEERGDGLFVQKYIELGRHEGEIRSASFSADGQRVVTASWDDTARIWSADGSGEPVVLRGHEDGVEAASFSPDGQRIVTASLDGTARVWSVDGIGEPVVLRGHKRVVSAASFSPDGRRVVTVSWDETIRVWSVDGVGEPLILRGVAGGVEAASFSADGRAILTKAKDGTARRWIIDATALRDQLRSTTAACLTPDQRRRYLSEPLKDAEPKWEACERAHGRDPRRHPSPNGEGAGSSTG
ncbi:MAG: CHAT domain-containing protein [Myxococcales bacterium]|nr:CHAT domain-containing protein [Myxococcales bacterium]